MRTITQHIQRPHRGLETDILSICRIHLPNYSLVLLRNFRNRLLARAFPADAPSAGGISLLSFEISSGLCIMTILTHHEDDKYNSIA